MTKEEFWNSNPELQLLKTALDCNVLRYKDHTNAYNDVKRILSRKKGEEVDMPKYLAYMKNRYNIDEWVAKEILVYAKQ